jgi:hypothetical protein
VVTNSNFSGNFAPGTGGGIAGAPVTITNSSFSGNGARYYGGGFYGSGVISDCTFSGDGAYSGGGIAGGPVTVTNSTFSGNGSTLTAQGDAVFVFGDGTVLKSTIVASSSNGGSHCFAQSGTITDAGYNISDDSSCGFSATGSHNDTDPKLDPGGLANNGGPTQTIALLSGSPAIDAIPIANCADQASPPNSITTDQRGFPRPDSGESACDIGAFEVQDFPFIPFSAFGGGLKIDPDAGIFVLGGRFVLGTGGTIDPASQPVAFAVGNDAVRLPAGSFVPDSVGYVYQKTINGIARYIHIKFTSAPGIYQLVALRKGGTLTTTTSPVPVTLTIGDNSGTTPMNATFN